MNYKGRFRKQHERVSQILLSLLSLCSRQMDGRHRIFSNTSVRDSLRRLVLWNEPHVIVTSYLSIVRCDVLFVLCEP